MASHRSLQVLGNHRITHASIRALLLRTDNPMPILPHADSQSRPLRSPEGLVCENNAAPHFFATFPPQLNQLLNVRTKCRSHLDGRWLAKVP